MTGIKKRVTTQLSSTESVVTTYLHSGAVCCSLQLTEDTDLQPLIYKTNSMDLITAKKKVVEKTAKMKNDKVLFLAVVKEGEEEGEVIIQDKLDDTCVAAYANGVEVPLPKLAPQTLKLNSMATKEKSKTAKKSLTKKVEKKVAAKKETPKKVVKGGKSMTVKSIISEVKKGSRFLNDAGKPLPLSYLEKMTNKDREMVVVKQSDN